MFDQHRIMCEKGQQVLYLFTQPFDVNATLVKGIFEHLHEDVLLDWAYDYLDTFDISFVGNIVKVVSGFTIVRNLEFSLQIQKDCSLEKSKVLLFKKSQ